MHAFHTTCMIAGSVIQSVSLCFTSPFSVMFYSATRAIYKANLNGSGITLVTYTALMPSLAVNADKKRICGVEQCISKIFCNLFK